MKNRDNSSIFSSSQYQKLPDSAMTETDYGSNKNGAAGANQVAPIAPGSDKRVAPDVTVDDSKSNLLLDVGARNRDSSASPTKGLSGDYSGDNIQ